MERRPLFLLTVKSSAIYEWLLVLVIISTVINHTNSQTNCPMQCSICLQAYMACMNGGMLSIPSQLQPGTERILLAGQFQFYGILTSANFTHLTPPKYNIENLAIRSSSIQELRSKTFSPLLNLKVLDLSENQRLTIFSSTFHGLNLNRLRIDEVGKLILSPGSFNGLTTEILSMKNSRLQSLIYDIFSPLSHTLKHLFIENNQIRTLDQKFEPLFYRLESVNLKDNPLICYCPLLWLSKALRSKMMSFQSPLDDDQTNVNEINNNPKCVAPSYLRNRQLPSITESEFNCQVPKIAQIEIDIISLQNGEMSCRIQPEEKGHKVPTKVFWQENTINGENIQFFNNKIQTTSDRVLSDENDLKDSLATIKIDGIGVSRNRNFRCIAENTAGRSIISVQISWPSDQHRNQSRNPNNNSMVLSKSDLSKTRHQFNTITTDSYLFTKQYTLLEMTIAIGGTFMVTVLVFMLSYKFYFRRKNGYKPGKRSLRYSLAGESPSFNTRSMMAFHGPRGGYTVYETSLHYSDNSQTYDSIPHNSVYPNQQQPLFSPVSNSPSAHFIDYKTHRNVYPSPPSE